MEGEELLLVSFVDEPEPRPSVRRSTPAETSRVAQLDQELDSTRQELERRFASLNASNQELTALNEEAVSLNEEFQSTNEELETSKEELQSLNEELTTANSQLQESLEQQRKTSTDLKNILNSSQIATLVSRSGFQDSFLYAGCRSALQAHRHGSSAGRWRILQSPSSASICSRTRVPCSAISRRFSARSKSGSGTWYMCGISPYRTQDDRIDGVVINLADISGDEGERGEAS